MSLAHQNIVPVFDFGRIDDQVFLAMERVEGSDLGSSLARAGAARLPPLLAAFVAAECCQALDYAHAGAAPDGAALGIVHRDVTPRNVLLSWSGEVKLTDFGIAALGADDGVGEGASARRRTWRRSRRAASASIARADVYAVGLVLREALTGERARAKRRARGDAGGCAKTGELVPWPADVEVPARLRAIVDRATARGAGGAVSPTRARCSRSSTRSSSAERAAKQRRGAGAPARGLAARDVGQRGATTRGRATTRLRSAIS